jgi:hypothetical protein
MIFTNFWCFTWIFILCFKAKTCFRFSSRIGDGLMDKRFQTYCNAITDSISFYCSHGSLNLKLRHVDEGG